MSIIEQFIECYFDGDVKAFRAARKEDYCKVQLAWMYFVDGLCKDGEITQEEFNRATFPRK